MSRPLTSHELARLMDSTLLRADATTAEFAALCTEARQHQFFCVCVPGSRVVQAAALLEDCEVKVCAVLDHPHGAADADVKRFAVETAIDQGAQIIEVTLNPGWLKDGREGALVRELRDAVEAAEERPVSMAVDVSLLTSDDLARACRLALEADASGVAAFASRRSDTRMQLALPAMRAIVGESFGLKAEAAKSDWETLAGLLDLGANRLGLSEAAAALNGLSP